MCIRDRGLTKTDMGAAFMIFEWAAIPSTLIAGWLIDKFFRGKIMYLPMICMTIVFFCVFGYMNSESIFAIILFSAIVGCLVYIPPVSYTHLDVYKRQDLSRPFHLYQ